MKHLLSIVLVVVFSFSPTVYAQELDFSQYENKTYDIAKSDLLAKGWRILARQSGESSISADYPEITCGSGSMAICSVGFIKLRYSVAFVVVESDNQLIVVGEY